MLALEGLYFYSAFNKKQAAVTTPPIPPKKLQIVVFKESGDVSYKVPSAADYVQMTSSSTEVPNLTSIRTTTGRGTVLLPDNSVISLSDNTEISINVNDTSTSIFQSVGNTYHRVQALVSGKSYEVQTPGTVAAVRGTKFAIGFDKNKNITKVAVTEHKVAVARIKKSFESNGTSSISNETKLEEIVVGEGNIVQVLENSTTTKTGTTTKTSMMVMGTIEKEVDMKVWVDENKVKDVIMETIKAQKVDPVEYRKEVENVLKKETEAPNPNREQNTEQKEKTDTNKNTKTEVKSDKKPDTKQEVKNEKTEVKNDTKPVTTKSEVKTITEESTPKTTGTSPKTTTGVTVLPMKKLNEDEFYDKFNVIFIKNFYVENDDSTCAVTLSSEAKVKEVSDYATVSGYPLPAGTTTSLKKYADDIANYCKNTKGDAGIRSRLQAQFDDEFPFAG